MDNTKTGEFIRKTRVAETAAARNVTVSPAVCPSGFRPVALVHLACPTLSQLPVKPDEGHPMRTGTCLGLSLALAGTVWALRAIRAPGTARIKAFCVDVKWGPKDFAVPGMERAIPMVILTKFAGPGHGAG